MGILNNMTMKKRYVIVMIICFLLNEILHQFANAFAWPMWLDTTGTALCAIMLEPTAALLVGLANNFILAIFYYDAKSMFYYATSASVALIVGLMLKKEGKIIFKRIPLTMVMCMIIPSMLSSAVTLWENAGISSSHWEAYYSGLAQDAGIPLAISCFLGTLALKIPDVIIGGIIVAIVYLLMPKALRIPSVKEVYKQKEMKEKLSLQVEAEKRKNEQEKKEEKEIKESLDKIEEEEKEDLIEEIKDEDEDE